MFFRPIALRFSRFAAVMTGVATATVLVAGSSIVASAVTVGPSVYTTTVDGTITNAPSYTSKDDVYLVAAPCPPTAGLALPAGDYYFEVTDETGTQRLSTDALSERLFEVAADGSITRVVSHDSAHFQCGPGGLSVRVQPFADLPAGQSRFTLRATPASSVNACGIDHPFCDADRVYATAFAIGPGAGSPSPSPDPSASPSWSPSSTASANPSASGSGSASTAPSGSAGPGGSPGSTASSTPRPSGSAPASSSQPSPTPSPRPTRTPGPTAPPAANPTPPPVVQPPPGGVYDPAPTPTWTPYVVPSGFFVCKPTEVITPTGCKTQAQLAAAARSAQPGGSQPGPGLVVGGTTPPTTPSDPGAIGPMRPGQSGAGVLGVLPTFPPGSGSTAPNAPGAPGAAVVGASAELPAQSGVAAAATGGAAPQSAGQNAGQNAAATNAAVSSDPATAATDTPAGSDRNIGFVVLGLFAAAAIAIASVAGRVLRRKRPVA